MSEEVPSPPGEAEALFEQGAVAGSVNQAMSLHFVLDGYNLINQDARMSGVKLEAGREALLKLVEERHGGTRNQVTVVFDGKVSGDDLRYSSGVRVIYTSRESADERIKQIVEDAGNPKSLVVVTGDKEIRHYVRALGAQLMDPKEFLRASRKRTGEGAGQTEKKDMTYSFEGKITSELARIWLKGKK